MISVLLQNLTIRATVTRISSTDKSPSIKSVEKKVQSRAIPMVFSLLNLRPPLLV